MLSLPEFFLKDEPRMTGNCCVFKFVKILLSFSLMWCGRKIFDPFPE